MLAGYDTPEHVLAAVAYENASEEEKDYASVLAGAPRHAYSGQCTYCGHCAPCSAGIDIAAVNKFRNLAQVQGEIPETVREHYRTLAHHASECIGCGLCEPRCPFGVEIVEAMRRAAERFGY